MGQQEIRRKIAWVHKNFPNRLGFMIDEEGNVWIKVYQARRAIDED